MRPPDGVSMRDHLRILQERELEQAALCERAQPEEAQRHLRRALWAERGLRSLDDPHLRQRARKATSARIT